jgi:hypothetical protein
MEAEGFSSPEEKAMKTVIAGMIALVLAGSSVAYAHGGGGGGSGTGGIDTQREFDNYKQQNTHQHYSGKIDWFE